jgi:hypothetical protein
MDQKTITVMNWMTFILVAPASIILIWKVVYEKLKGRGLSSDLIPGALLYGLVWIGLAELNIDGRPGWLSWGLLVAQLILLVFLFKRLWSPLKQQLRG